MHTGRGSLGCRVAPGGETAAADFFILRLFCLSGLLRLLNPATATYHGAKQPYSSSKC